MKIRTLVLMLLISFAFSPAFVSPPSKMQKQKTVADTAVVSSGNYEKLWDRVDSLSRKGLSKSALEQVIVVYKKAKTENNAPQLVKAVIHRMKFQSYTEEDVIKKIVPDLKSEISESTFPARPLLHSMLAEIYWRYYEQNRYRFLNRTETVDYKNDDITTWDLRKILGATMLEYALSLSGGDSSKNAQVNIYDDVIEKGKPEDTRKFRPSLYDFLAHRALDFYMNDETGLTEPANKFEMNSEMYLARAEIFLTAASHTGDSSSMTYHALRLFQSLLAFHRRDIHPGAFINVDLERLKFVYGHCTVPEKDSLYTKTLRNIEIKYHDYPGCTDALYELATLYYGWGNRYSYGDEPEVKWLNKTAKEICDDAIARFPYSSGGLNCKSLVSRIEEKSMAFTVEEVSVPNKPFLARFDYKNLKKIYFRISLNDRDKLKRESELYGEKLVQHYIKLPPIKQWNVDVENDGDFQLHSVELKFPELPLGNYVLLSSADPDFTTDKNGVAYATCWISNISYMNRRMGGGNYDFYLFNRETGEPLPGVTADLYGQQYSYQSRTYEYVKTNTFTSDADGYFSVESATDYRNFNIEFKKGNDRLFLNDNFYQSPNDGEKRRVRQQTFFFTDRSIYRPGQTVYFKGIIIETDGEKNSIQTKQATTVTFFDANGEKVSEQKFTTNEYGTFNGSFTAPVGLLNGMMRIANETGAVYFSVEEYKRPKFEVEFEPVSGTFRLNEKISVTGKAVSFSGAAVDNARVQYRVIRTTLLPYWNYYRRPYPSSPQIEITHGVITTNATGEFVIAFEALPDAAIGKESNPVFNFQITADVTDINGETQSESQVVGVSYKTLLLSVTIPNVLNRESSTDFEISTKNLAGVFVASAGTVSIARLRESAVLLRKKKWAKPEKQLLTKEEYQHTFPYDVYHDEDNPEKWETESVVFNSAFDTGKDTLLHLPALKEWEPGVYKLDATSKDKYGQDIKFTTYITVFSAKEKHTPNNQQAWFSVLRDNAEPGDTDRFLIGSHDKNVTVLYEIEQKNKIISTQWLRLNDEQRLIEIPIKEEFRGNIAVHFSFVKHNRDYRFDQVLTVPYTNKQLDISFESFRSKLYPGQKEEWSLKIRGKGGEKVTAEFLASMYDASLDAFQPHNWLFNIYNSYYASLSLSANRSFGVSGSSLYSHNWNVYLPVNYKTYDQLNWFGFSGEGAFYLRGSRSENTAYSLNKGTPATMSTITSEEIQAAPARDVNSLSVNTGKSVEKNSDSGDKTTPEKENGRADLSGIYGRTNFNETAFFYPQLTTNDSGEVVISFTIPEALTRWKMMGFASTSDLKYGLVEKELITQKELMVIPDPPRFFREGDTISFTTKITNLSDTALSGTAQLFLYDAITMKPLSIFIPSAVQNIKGKVTSVSAFTASKGQSATATWELSIPEGVGAITYKVVAKAGNYSDGEEQAIPVLSNRMLVTETLPLPVKGKQSKTFEFTKLKNSGTSTTLRNHKLTLEFTSNPAWYAIQALPYLMEFPYECSEQIFSRYYANAIASHIANSSPKIKAVFDSWKSQSPEALLSNLEKNQELKTLLLEETPWVLDSKNESERKKRVALLFDFNKMSNGLAGALNKLQKKQVANGAWSWFDGMPDDRYITQYIVEGFGHLDHLGITIIRDDAKTWNMVTRAVQYLDARISDDYNRLVERKADLSKNQLSSVQIQYLYARSYFKDIPVSPVSKKSFDYYQEQGKKFWLDNGEYLQGMIALALYRFGDKSTPDDILKSLKENSQYNDELGMYWKNIAGGYYWTQAPVETQALLIEAFDEVGNDQKSVNDMKVWLLKQKQTQDWKTTKATAEACYALLLRGTNWLAESTPVEITIGGKKINSENVPDLKTEAGTGYIKTSWSGGDVKPEMATVHVDNKNEGVAWGALYWQYFERLDKITPHQTPLNLKKELFLEKPSATGLVIVPVTPKTLLRVGDRLKVRIELRVDRGMEYVMMKDMRAAGFEPEQVLSQYNWQDGLGYYETTRDASVNFFFSWLQKGTYVFEYPLRVSHSGDFSNGITEIQCMYAPEFTAHSEGIRVGVKK